MRAGIAIYLLLLSCLLGLVVLPGYAQCRAEVEANDTTDAADGLGTLPGTGCRGGAVFPSGDVDLYWFDVQESVDVVIETWTDGDTLLSLYDESGDLLAEDDDSGNGYGSRMAGSLQVGTYLVVVSAYGSNVVSSYEVRIQGLASASASAYAPDATCPLEKENNNTAAFADDLSAVGGVPCRTGSIAPAGDVDVYAFRVDATAPVVVETKTAGDTILRLYDVEGRLLAEDDDGGDAAASRIAATLDAGRYYATVREYSDSVTIPSYRITVTASRSPGGATPPPGQVTSPPAEGGGVTGSAPPWGWSIWGGGPVLSAWGSIDRDCPSDYDFNMGLCDKKTYTFSLGSPGFIALALIDQAGEWITANVYDAGHQRVAVKLGQAGPIYSNWFKVAAGTYTVEVVPGKRLDKSPYELHVFFSATEPDPDYLVRTYGPANRQLPG